MYINNNIRYSDWYIWYTCNIYTTKKPAARILFVSLYYYDYYYDYDYNYDDDTDLVPATEAFGETLKAVCACKSFKLLHLKEAEEFITRLHGLQDICRAMVLSNVNTEQELLNVDEADARFFIHTIYKMNQKDFITDTFDSAIQEDDIVAIRKVAKQWSASPFHSTCLALAMAEACPAIEDCKRLATLFEHTAAIPKKENLEAISKHEMQADFSKALGILMTVPGKSKLHMQMQFLQRCSRKSGCPIGRFRSRHTARRFQFIILLTIRGNSGWSRFACAFVYKFFQEILQRSLINLLRPQIWMQFLRKNWSIRIQVDKRKCRCPETPDFKSYFRQACEILLHRTKTLKCY